MSYLSDTLTVGLILVLVFGSIALYLYTRVQQTEQKVSLLESIVLDLKLTGEIPSFSDPHPFSASSYLSAPSASSALSIPSASSAPPAPSASSVPSASSASSAPSVPSDSLLPIQEYKPFDDTEIVEENAFSSVDLLNSQESLAEPLESLGPLESLEPLEPLEPLEQVEAIPLSSYDHMSVKELQAEARTRGLSVEKGAKKHSLIELLKKGDAEAKSAPTSSLTSLEPFAHDEE